MHPIPTHHDTAMRGPHAAPSAPLSRNVVVAALIAFTLIWFCNLDFRRLVHPDEGRYAEIAREMAQTGDWLTPRLNGIKYFEKPALQYWISAAAIDAFGLHHWTVRLWPALAGWLGVLFIGYTGWRLGGSTLGVFAAAALAGSVWWVLNAHVLTLDAGLSFWMGLGLGCLLIAQTATTDKRARLRWMMGAWAALALAVLSKGLIGVVLPGGAVVAYMILERDGSLLKRLHLVAGACVFLAIAAPWFVAVSLRNPEFFDFFFIHEHFTRFLTHEARREAAWWFFLPILAVGILPWLPLFVWMLKRSWTDADTSSTGFAWQRFALVWSAVILVFFSVSSSKLPSYILPMFPALALVIAWQLRAARDVLLIRLSLPVIVLCGAAWIALLFGADVIAARFAGAQQPLAPLLAYASWIRWALFAAFAGGAAGLWALRRGRRDAAVMLMALASLAAAQLVLSGHDTLAESRSSQPLLARIALQNGALAEGAAFYTVRMYDQTLPYYLGRSVIQVEHPDELAMGIASEPDKAIATVALWRDRWQQSKDAYAMMQPDEYDALQRDGVPMRELGRDTRRVIVSRY